MNTQLKAWCIRTIQQPS